MTRDLSRLLSPRSVAVIGGGAWGAAVIAQLRKIGFDGDIWPIHPAKSQIEGLRAYRGVPELPGVVDAAFVGINREATIGAVERLRKAGAGGAVCFASGFAEVGDGGELDARLRKAAGDMPILGPNCYGYVNMLDGACIWPDQHGMGPVDRGVAILTQSSNLAINLSFQNRALPLAMLVTCGNMAQTRQVDIASHILDDPRITAIGLHIEGFAALDDWIAFARRAFEKRVPVIAIKTGRSEAARAATLTHTASLAGEEAGAAALLRALGIGRVETLPQLCEALMLAHVCGPLPHRTAASVSCSGGEASLAADLGEAHGILFPPLDDHQRRELEATLGAKVTLANPLDYHTYIWRDPQAMARCWTAMAKGPAALTLSIVDIPDKSRADPGDWDCALEAVVATRKASGKPVAMVSTMPEAVSLDISRQLIAEGVAPLRGLDDAMAALSAVASDEPAETIWHAPVPAATRDETEGAAKASLAARGLAVPRRWDGESNLAEFSFPAVAKRSLTLHKTEAGGVRLGLADEWAAKAALNGLDRIDADAPPAFLEEMITDAVAELLVGITLDPAHGYLLTLGAGGTQTELWQDTQHLAMPASPAAIGAALDRLRIAPLLAGFRGAPPADKSAIVDTVLGLQDWLGETLRTGPALVEVEINPLLCTPTRAVIADAILRWAQPETAP